MFKHREVGTHKGGIVVGDSNPNVAESDKRECRHFKSTLVFALQRALSQIKADFESKLKFSTIYSSGTPSTQRVSTILLT